jgi:hypothetical protein
MRACLPLRATNRISTRLFWRRSSSEPAAVKHKGPGKAPAPVLRDVLLYLRRLAPVRATGRHLPFSCPLPP